MMKGKNSHTVITEVAATIAINVDDDNDNDDNNMSELLHW
jgi:hypothetical protein